MSRMMYKSQADEFVAGVALFGKHAQNTESAFATPRASHARKVCVRLSLSVCCECVRAPEFLAAPGLGSRNANGPQLRPVALVGVEGPPSETKEGLRAGGRVGPIRRLVLIECREEDVFGCKVKRANEEAITSR